MPIIDFHCHLPVKEIAEDRKFQNLTQVWIEGDHYKWRAMRALGIEEKYITGDSSDEEKFIKWAETIPYTMRNPLYHWTHLELKRYFGIEEILNGSSAKRIYKECNKLLAKPEFSTQNLLKKMNVKVVCTTDDPASDLLHHRQLAEDGYEETILPTFSPDNFLNIEAEGFTEYLEGITSGTEMEVLDFDSLLKVIKSRILFFHNHGCRLSDHGLDYAYAEDFTGEILNKILLKKLKGENIDSSEALTYKSGLMFHLGNVCR